MLFRAGCQRYKKKARLASGNQAGEEVDKPVDKKRESVDKWINLLPALDLYPQSSFYPLHRLTKPKV